MRPRQAEDVIREVVVPQRVVPAGSEVRPEQRDGRRNQQHRPAHGFAVEELGHPTRGRGSGRPVGGSGQPDPGIEPIR